MPEIEIRFASDREYERLRTIRDKYGVQWRGMLIQGAKQLERGHPPGALSELSRTRDERPLRDCTDPTLERNDVTGVDADLDHRRSFESP